MSFSVDTDAWFIISFLFISALGLFIAGYVAIPYFIRKRQLKRMRNKSLRRGHQYKQFEKRSSDRELSDLALRNQRLETDLHKSLLAFIKSGAKELTFGTFYAEFEKVYPSFNESLRSLIPGITAHELKLCALIRMKLTAKEVGGILNISPASVNKARYRLRKKMALGSKEDLDLFLLNI